MSLYHVTPARNLDGIAQDGLIPVIGPRAQTFGEEEKAVYCFRSLGDLEDALGAPWLEEAFDPDQPLVALQIDVNPTDISHIEGAGFEFVFTEVIDPSFINILSLDVWTEVSIQDLKPEQSIEDWAQEKTETPAP